MMLGADGLCAVKGVPGCRPRQQLMNSPMVQQMMSNPEVLRPLWLGLAPGQTPPLRPHGCRTMVRMNPQLNELMEQRPESPG